jgi:hypothetical protein
MVLMAEGNSPGLKPLMFLLTLSAVVLVSGCTDQGGVSYGKGVVITDFDSDFSSLQSGEDLTLRLRVQNQGEADAENVKAQIIGIDLDEWGTGFGWSEEEDLGTLIAADPTTNTEGQMKQAEWYLEAPDYPENIKFTHTPEVRVTYDYTTTALKSITLVDVDELRRIRDAGKTIPGGATQSSAGPLSVQIKTGDFVKTQQLKDPFPLNIIIRNDQTGYVLEGDGYYGGWGADEYSSPVKVTITLPSGMSLEPGEGCSTSGEWVNLFRGKEHMLTCEISIDDPPEVKVEKYIQVDLEYTYAVDASTTVEVVGTEEGWGL